MRLSDTKHAVNTNLNSKSTGFNTDSQWDYTQQFEGATTAPIVEVVTVDFETTNALEKSGEDVTATLEVKALLVWPNQQI